MEQVILVDPQDREIGTMEKMEAHKKGVLHRAFSILLFNSKGEMLLQKRAGSKYHSPGLWTNTCCSHPKPGESMRDATARKLMQEMGIASNTAFRFKFTYRTELEEGLVEHEIDHVFTGTFDGMPIINKQEVDDWKFTPVGELRQDISANPDRYTFWFRKILDHPDLRDLTN